MDLIQSQALLTLLRTAPNHQPLEKSPLKILAIETNVIGQLHKSGEKLSFKKIEGLTPLGPHTIEVAHNPDSIIPGAHRRTIWGGPGGPSPPPPGENLSRANVSPGQYKSHCIRKEEHTMQTD